MNRRMCFASLLAVFLCWEPTNAQWRIPSDAPLLTPWAKNVPPAVQSNFQPLQMTRDEWMDLKGLWQCATAKPLEGPPSAATLQHGKLVLFPTESAITAAMRDSDFTWFRRTVTLPPSWTGRQVLLHVNGADGLNALYFNHMPIRVRLGSHSATAVTQFLNKDGSQEITVGVYNTPGRARGARASIGIAPESWYSPSRQVVQTIWLEPVEPNQMTSVLILPETGGKRVSLAVGTLQAEDRLDTVRAIIREGGKFIAEAKGKPHEALAIPLESPRYWSPSHPFLYDLEVVLVRGNERLDVLRGQFGIRKQMGMPPSVLGEYPRPQMVRREWMNLNGLWEYTVGMGSESLPTRPTLKDRSIKDKILVPFPVQSALSGVMKSVDRLSYRRTFELPDAWRSRRLILHFGAVDYYAEVFVNGRRVGDHTGGYDPFSFDISDQLREQGPQEIVVHVSDPTDKGDQPRGKQVLKPESIWYTPTTGIWQTVWLEPVEPEHITELLAIPDVDGNKLRLTVNSTGDAAQLTVRVEVFDEGKKVAAIVGAPAQEIAIPIRSPKLWSPSHPHLYDLSIELQNGGARLDFVKSYFGMRSVEIGRGSRGINRILLNGKFVMQVGPLDQGFWPDGIYTAPSDEALRSDIEMMKKLGFNMVRKHVKVEPDRWYYWADKLGLLVWQDMPSGNNRTDDSKKQFETELERLIKTHRNHPSIIMWVVFNEGWGQYDTERLAAWVKQLDSTRLVNNASGWTDKKSGDVLDIHNYPVPKSPEPDSGRAIVLGEFGGLGLATEGHTWKKEHWGYQGMMDAEQLTSRYEKFMKKVYELKDKPGLSAAVYTQLTDVEVECNGLLTYDRAIVKPNLARIAAVNRGDFSMVPPPPIVKVVVATSEEKGREWRYTLEKPLEDWFKLDFSDAAWKQGTGGFGTKETPGAIVRTEWNTSDIWMRSTVEIPAKKFVSLRLRLHHDDDAEVYINGVLAGSFGRYTAEYEEAPIAPAALSALKPGKNTLAVHCKQTGGGQYIDVGIVDVVPPAKKK